MDISALYASVFAVYAVLTLMPDRPGRRPADLVSGRFGDDGHIFEAEGYRISIGESLWRMCEEDPAFEAALRVVVRDTEGVRGAARK